MERRLSGLVATSFPGGAISLALKPDFSLTDVLLFGSGMFPKGPHVKGLVLDWCSWGDLESLKEGA